MTARLAERLEATHEAREASVATQRPTGSSLILLRHQVVEDAFRTSGPRLQAMPGLSLRNDGAFRAGRAAGDRVNLKRPIQHCDQERLG